jgi:4'-phosphopantetheinyl transferase
MSAPSRASWKPAAGWSPPEPGVLDLWRIALDDPAPPKSPLSAEERRRAERFLSAQCGRRFANARTALRVVLGRYLGREPQDLELLTGPNGKPELPGCGISFNLSHSASLGLLAVARDDMLLGVDVERRDGERPLDRLAQRFFSPEEAEAYAALPSEERLDAFYRIWTRKEAYLKALGTGLTFSSRRFTLAIGPGSGRLLRATERPDEADPGAWWFEDEPGAGDGYTAAVCWRGEPRKLRKFELALSRAAG